MLYLHSAVASWGPSVHGNFRGCVFAGHCDRIVYGKCPRQICDEINQFNGALVDYDWIQWGFRVEVKTDGEANRRSWGREPREAVEHDVNIDVMRLMPFYAYESRRTLLGKLLFVGIAWSERGRDSAMAKVA